MVFNKGVIGILKQMFIKCSYYTYKYLLKNHLTDFVKISNCSCRLCQGSLKSSSNHIRFIPNTKCCIHNKLIVHLGRISSPSDASLPVNWGSNNIIRRNMTYAFSTKYIFIKNTNLWPGQCRAGQLVIYIYYV